MLLLQLLGGLQITLDDEPVTGFVSSKAQALLCYLALNPDQTPLRATLASMFWSDMLDEDAATNLRQVVANLKRLLEPYFEITRQTIAFNADAPHWIDVRAFEAARDPALYRGELLAGFGVADAPEFDGWLTTERERLHELALVALRQQAESQRLAGDEEAALQSLNRLLRLDPLQEDAYRRAMLLLAVNGQRSAALALYERCHETLKRELGVEPEVETARLFDRIKSARQIAAAIKPLPNEMTPFIGRGEELNDLTRRLSDPTCHLIAVVGLGGMGKTRLALHLAHMQANRMLHGVAMVNLVSIRTLDSFLTALADAFHLQLMMQGTPRGQVLDFLREKHMLLILDNVEQLAGVIDDFLGELTRTAGDLKIVMTSRQRFNLRGEWTLALDGLPVEDPTPEVEAPPAQRLFWETAQRVRGDDLLTRKSAEAVRRICRLVDGMPLAIELAAAWARLLTVEELAEEIGSNLTGLEASSPTDEERHRSLRSVFDYSWQLYPVPEQQMLMALSLFAGGFTREAAKAVAGASTAALLGFADKMLVQRHGEGRFMLHEMLRQYLMEKLTGSGGLAAESAYSRYFIGFLQARQARLKTHEQQALLDEITQEIDNIHFAWDVAVQQGRWETLAELMPGLSLFHDLKSNWRVAAELFQSAEGVLDPADVDLYGAWLSHLALATSRLDQREQTTALAQRCMELLPRDNPAYNAHIARALMALGYSESLRGAHEAAIAYAEDALSLRVKLGDEWECAQSLLRLASGHAQRAQVEVHYGESHHAEMMAHLEKARPYAQQALAISTRLGDQFLTARLRTLLANVLQMEGSIDESLSLHQGNLAFYEAVGSLDGRCMTLNGMGNAAFMRERYADAVPLYVEALALARQIGARAWEANGLNNLAVSSYKLGDLWAARSYFTQSQEGFRALGHEQYVGLIQQDIDEIDARLKSS